MSDLEQNEPMRLSKRMSQLGLASRREADEWISRGWVFVDGQKAALGQKVLPGQKITIADQAKQDQADKVTVLLNKPLGYVSGQAEDGYLPAKVLITPENHWTQDRSGRSPRLATLKGLVPAGRLDINSTGLLVLTQDGRVAKTLIGEHSYVEKEYIVRVEMADGRPNSEFTLLAKLRHGLSLDGKALLPAQVDWINDNQLKFVLHEGRYRQIRRMCELVGLKVKQLKRVRIGSVNLGKLPSGQWRFLAPGETFQGHFVKRFKRK